jgi:hypothetical protein
MYNPFWEQAKRVMANRKPIVEEEDKLPPLPTIRKEEKFKEDISDYSFKDDGGHVLVYKRGVFQYSADTMKEAREIFYSGDF